MPTNALFRNATVRLTAMYMVILMSISMLFSFGLYQVSADELEKGIRRPTSNIDRVLRTLRGTDFEDIQDAIGELRAQELKNAQDRLRNNLVLINLFIFITGGLLSYVLARRTLEPIERAHESQSRFTADASHELRTPIAAMKLETEVSLSDPKLSVKDARTQLESNIEELDKLTALTENLLTLARTEENSIETSQVHLQSIINAAIDRTESKAKSKKVVITSTGAKSVSIDANPAMLTEALTTILDNAVKYSPKNSKVTITTKTHSREVAISITDKGIGMEDTEVPFIFDRFYRADSSRTKSSEHGYGIGLSIAKAAVEAHGGSITVTSKPGSGSTFTISLPK